MEGVPDKSVDQRLELRLRLAEVEATSERRHRTAALQAGQLTAWQQTLDQTKEHIVGTPMKYGMVGIEGSTVLYKRTFTMHSM